MQSVVRCDQKVGSLLIPSLLCVAKEYDALLICYATLPQIVFTRSRA